ncbi:replication initiation protein [Vibrio maritimus]|uniref:replication initiation protein n=1 Tax=Vibrio maritimus TaxID=990268 RepID=UPI001F30FEFE|nr:replication initiation protein [Vibrio maritimus]
MSIEKDKIQLELPTNLVRKYHSGTESHIKSNDIVFASLKLTPKMCDLMSLLFTKMREDDWYVDGDVTGEHAEPCYEFTAKEIAEFFPNIKTTNQVSATIKKPAQRLMETAIGIERGNGDFRYTPLFSDCIYDNGVLRMYPNNRLRESYIAKAKTKGYALINNEQYLALKDAHSKKTLDLLSRFKTGNHLYPLSLKKLQIIYGVYGPDGKLQLPSYKSPKTFLSRLIESSLETIANSLESQERIEIMRSEAKGTLGYEVVNDDSSGKIDDNTRIRFLYRWTATFSEENIKDAKKEVERLMFLNAKVINETGSRFGLTGNQYLELAQNLKVVSSESEESEKFYQPMIEKVEKTLNELITSLEKQQQEEEMSMKNSLIELSNYL